VGELALEYEGRVEFVIVPADQTARRTAEIDAYGFTDQKHGLVGFGSDGRVLVKIPGHDYGKPRVREAVETVLAAEGG
jgi:hypothetical protein